MNPIEVAYFVNPVLDLPKARDFYEGILGLVPTTIYENGAMGWVEYEIGSSVLALGSGVEHFKPSPNGGSIALEVDNFEEAIRELKDSGCKFHFEAVETPVCHMAAVADPDGNTVIIHKRKSHSP